MVFHRFIDQPALATAMEVSTGLISLSGQASLAME